MLQQCSLGLRVVDYGDGDGIVLIDIADTEGDRQEQRCVLVAVIDMGIGRDINGLPGVFIVIVVAGSRGEERAQNHQAGKNERKEAAQKSISHDRPSGLPAYGDGSSGRESLEE